MKKSFTILEFLMYIGLLSVILLVFINLFVSLTEIRIENESTSSVQQDGTYLINRFMYDIRRAKIINLPLHPNDQSNILNLEIDGANYSYATDSAKNLIISEGVNNYQLNSYDVTIPSITFTRFGQDDIHDVIKISFIVNNQVYETVVGLREKP